MMSAGDEFCGCINNPPNVHEFVGPVKIVLVDFTPLNYRRRSWGSAFVAFGNLVMASVVVIVILLTLYFGLPMEMNGHIASCTLGFQLFLPNGILMMNPLFGPTIHVKLPHRKYQHILFQHMTVAFGFGGGVFALLAVPSTITVHKFTGIVTMVCTVLTVLIGPLVLFFDPVKWHKFRTVHETLGIITFAISTLCFCTGCLKPSFKRWCTILHLSELPMVVSILCIFYSVVFLLAIYWKSSLNL